jgi:hypothetical protein
MIPTVIAPLSVLREGRQSVALAEWGSWDLVSNQADMILHIDHGKTQLENANTQIFR